MIQAIMLHQHMLEAAGFVFDTCKIFGGFVSYASNTPLVLNHLGDSWVRAEWCLVFMVYTNRNLVFM